SGASWRRAQPRDSWAQRLEERRNRIGVPELLRAEVIAPAVAYDSSLGVKLLVLSGRERQPADLLDEVAFLTRGQKVGLVDVAFREGEVDDREQGALRHQRNVRSGAAPSSEFFGRATNFWRRAAFARTP